MQATESLIFTNLEISIFCAVEKQVGMFLISFKSKNVFVFSISITIIIIVIIIINCGTTGTFLICPLFVFAGTTSMWITL